MTSWSQRCPPLATEIPTLEDLTYTLLSDIFWGVSILPKGDFWWESGIGCCRGWGRSPSSYRPLSVWRSPAWNGRLSKTGKLDWASFQHNSSIEQYTSLSLQPAHKEWHNRDEKQCYNEKNCQKVIKIPKTSGHFQRWNRSTKGRQKKCRKTRNQDNTRYVTEIIDEETSSQNPHKRWWHRW